MNGTYLPDYLNEVLSIRAQESEKMIWSVAPSKPQ